jgi:hypothetical protein
MIRFASPWGEDRVWFHDRNGRLHSIPAGWTDIAEVDPFVVVAAGRSLFRITDLLELTQLIKGMEAGSGDCCVKEKMSLL